MVEKSVQECFPTNGCTILAFSDPHIHILLLFDLELEHVVVDIMQEVYKSSNSFIDFH